MYLEKIPKADGKLKRILSINDNTDDAPTDVSFIDASLSDDLLTDVDRYDDWLDAFREHYIQETGRRCLFAKYSGVQLRGAKIPLRKPRIDMRVDWGHYALKFWSHKQDKKARDMIYNFLNRIEE